MSFETDDVLLLHVEIDWKMNITANLLLYFAASSNLFWGHSFVGGKLKEFLRRAKDNLGKPACVTLHIVK